MSEKPSFFVDDATSAVEERFVFDETDESQSEKWEVLKTDCMAAIERTFGAELGSDYEVADWHHGVMRIWIYLYSEKLYSDEFILEVLSVLRRHGDAFASFECYDASLDDQGIFQVFPDNRVQMDDRFSKSEVAGLVGFRENG